MFKNNKASKSKGKGTEKTVSFAKTIDILNYTPLEYRLTQRWADFSDIDKFEALHTKKIKDLEVDEMCGDMLDSYIISEADIMKASAAEQHIYHESVIQHHKGLLEGELEKLNLLLSDLEEDLVDLNHEIDRYVAIQKEENK